MMSTLGYAAQSPTTPLGPFQFTRREMKSHDILIDILFCGICHSDLHVVRNEWGKTMYPVVPGHEILGRVSKVGKEVTSFKEGDLVGVGCIVNSCRKCSSCLDHLEQYCEQGFTLSFNAVDQWSQEISYGGFSKHIIVEDQFVVHIPKKFKPENLPAVAPILCAGITTYSPLKHWKVGKGSKVGIVGLGGLGHMAVQLAHAMGAHVAVFTTSANKVAEAKKLGAHTVILSNKEGEMKQHKDSFDFILNTVASSLNLNQYLELLKRDATMCLVGLPEAPHAGIEADSLIRGRKNLAGSLIGGIQETEEVLDFCAQHNILAKVEVIPITKVNEAFDRMVRNDVKYRFVIDMASLK